MTTHEGRLNTTAESSLLLMRTINNNDFIKDTVNTRLYKQVVTMYYKVNEVDDKGLR